MVVNWAVIFGWSKKIHRWVMWVVLTLGLTMMTSGYLMNRELVGDSTPTRLDMLLVRYIHVTVSMWFLFSLAAQMVTGLLMWLAPKMLAKLVK